MEVQIGNDKIFAPLKGKWLVLKPEEEVRQTYICRLVDYYGYSLSQMDQEIQVLHRKPFNDGTQIREILLDCCGRL